MLYMLTHWFAGEGFLTFFQFSEILMVCHNIYNPPSTHIVILG